MLINLTPHTLNVHTPSGVVDIPTSGTVARVATTETPCEEVAGIPVTRTVFGEVTGLPEPHEGVFLVVSLLVRTAAEAAGRVDCLSPGPLVRDADGRPVGCRGLTRG